MGVVFGILGVIFRVQKKSRNKERKNELILRRRDRPGGMRGSPGEPFGGVKILQKGEEQQEAEQKEELKSEHCRVVPHAPCPRQAGAGGLTTPKGGAPPAPHLVQCPSELWTSSGVVLCCVCCAVSAVPCLLRCMCVLGVRVVRACVRLQGSLSVAGCKGAAIAKFLAAFVGRSR